MIAGLGVFWLSARGEASSAAAGAMAASLSCAFFAGPSMGLFLLQSRSLIYLPASRRQLWRARLVVAVVAPVALILAAKLVALSARALLQAGDAVTFQTVLLSSLCDLAYAGAGVALFTWADPGLRAQRGVDRLGSAPWIASLLAFGMGPVWPWIFRGSLPTAWAEVTPWGWLVLAAALAASAATLLHEPTIAHPGRGQWTAPGAKIPYSSGTRSTPAAGIARLVWPEIAARVALIVLTLGAFWLLDLLYIEYLGAGMLPDNLLVGGLALVYLALPTTMGVGSALRPLRALPISTGALASLLAAQPLATLLAASAVFAATSWLSGLRAPAPAAALGVCLVGAAPLVNAVAFALSRVFRGGLFLGPVLGGLGFLAFLASRLPLSPPSLVTASLVAVAGVVAAVGLNVRTLRRSRSVYRVQAPDLQML
jgi:hypothetical protein